MRQLQRSLKLTFAPTRPRQTRAARGARLEAVHTAAQHGIEIEPFDRSGGGGMNVWPPKGLAGEDPFEGDHYATDWVEALSMVQRYAAAIAEAAQT